ncbi:hypothetical protein VHA01S_003_00510 [Vibrio halioticoli NBRC 102217]|uniref:O-antigen ligase-related domain-containing protein n=1 Tax=Vibrio halioticoli NBRC 102217 TaxID=1219072 RepID=V5HEH9_9VIBR|nr:O-antigen ligase family protein [Vibrio halioticoli]GAD87975.1 hypothetical protein VHA01S_003_00510 [Vibrio halioticoli NBRC 102217]
MQTKINYEQIKTFFYCLPLYWAISGLFLVDSGDKKLVVLILLTIPFKLISYFKGDKNLNIDILGISLIIFSFISCYIYTTKGYSSSEIRTVLSLTFFYIFIFNKSNIINHRIMSCVLFITASISVYNTYDFVFLSDIGRGYWYINAIPYANQLSMLLMFALFNFTKDTTKTRYLSLLSSGLFLCSIFISDTRGAWVSLFLCSIIAMIIFRKSLIKDKLLLSTIIISTMIILLATKNNISERLEQTKTEISAISKDNLNTSLGIRIQLWSLGLKFIKEDFSLTGYGQKGHLNKIKQLKKHGKIKGRLARFDSKNFHNDFIDRTVKYGLFGLSSLIFFIVFPLKLGFKSKDIEVKALLIITPLYMISACMSYISFSYSTNLATYLIIIMIATIINRESNRI